MGQNLLLCYLKIGEHPWRQVHAGREKAVKEWGPFGCDLLVTSESAWAQSHIHHCVWWWSAAVHTLLYGWRSDTTESWQEAQVAW
jgi:hypothetical protein